MGHELARTRICTLATRIYLTARPLASSTRVSQSRTRTRSIRAR